MYWSEIQNKSVQVLSFWKKTEARTWNSIGQNTFFFPGSGGFQLQSYKTETAPRGQGNLS